MPSITDMINEKYGVAGGNIADAISQIGGFEPGQGIDNIADAIAFAKDYQNLSDWTLTALAAPSTLAMPTTETAANSGHATIAFADGTITITLDETVAELEDADHGATWGEHKWLGFGVRTGLSSVAGVTFKDDTGAKATMSTDDDGEAATLGLSAGDFVLYIKAEDPAYLTGAKYFTLTKEGYKPIKVKMKVVEPTG